MVTYISKMLYKYVSQETEFYMWRIRTRVDKMKSRSVNQSTTVVRHWLMSCAADSGAIEVSSYRAISICLPIAYVCY